MIDPLADNGGPTLTHAHPTGSPAINAGARTCIATNQCGVPRLYGDRCDVGAFEVQMGELPRQLFLPLVAR